MPPTKYNIFVPHIRIIHGFTMVEMVVVLLILGILSASVALSLRGVGDRAQLQDAVSAFRQYEQLARSHAYRTQTACQLVYQINTAGSLTNQNIAGRRVDAHTQRPLGSPLCLPGGFHIAQLWTPDERVLDGQIGLACSSRGQTSSYAVLVRRARQQTWLFVAGLTGQITEYENVEQVRTTLHALQTSRHELD